MDSWMRDMKGVLIFAALFSAILTAFIIESYQALQPDPTDAVVGLLTRISGQMSDLVHLSNASISASPQVLDAQPHAVSFKPTTSSLLCNTLWFTSLFLSLTCALLATLVEQWAWGFTQKIDGTTAPVVRAKIFAYVYSGLRKFDMHTVVELIPVLLHASLLLFFAGLVAFLVPISPVLVAIASVWLALIVVSYGLLTILPLFRPECPYWTPLSGILWRFLQMLQRFSLHALHASSNISYRGPKVNIVDHMVEQATKISDDSAERDIRALCWTARSTTDGDALELFIDGISDAVLAPEGRRYSHDNLIVGLLQDGEARVISRIERFLINCQSDVLSPAVAIRRRVACLKTIWAIVALSESAPELSSSIDSLASSLIGVPSLLSMDCPETADYIPSVRALLLWKLFRSFSIQVKELVHLLDGNDMVSDQGNSSPIQLGHDIRLKIRSIAQKIE
ncbi:hypothetical protein DFH07DRAFT_1034788, partial [Mycena maculata]